MKVRVTIESTHELEVDEFNEDIRRYITENYEVASLPVEYQDDAEYEGGSITYEIVEE